MTVLLVAGSYSSPPLSLAGEWLYTIGLRTHAAYAIDPRGLGPAMQYGRCARPLNERSMTYWIQAHVRSRVRGLVRCK